MATNTLIPLAAPNKISPSPPPPNNHHDHHHHAPSVGTGKTAPFPWRTAYCSRYENILHILSYGNTNKSILAKHLCSAHHAHTHFAAVHPWSIGHCLMQFAQFHMFTHIWPCRPVHMFHKITCCYHPKYHYVITGMLHFPWVP